MLALHNGDAAPRFETWSERGPVTLFGAWLSAVDQPPREGHTRGMVWAKAALAGGLLVVLAAFAFGTEHQPSTLVMGHDVDCGPAIPASWLVSGTPDSVLDPGPGATVEDRRAATACGPVIHQSRVVTLATMGVGGLAALVGWTGIRGQRDGRTRQVTPVHG